MNAHTSHARPFCLLLALALPCTSALAAPQFVASEIPRANLEEQLYLADMNGDGASDVLLGHWSEQAGRELHIYLQQPDGRFPSLPSRRVEIRPEIIAFATADLRDEPGDELVFVSSDAVYSFSSAIDAYAGNLRKLVDWPLIASTPERKQLPWLGALPDLDADGHVDLLLPDDDGYGHFRGEGDEQFAWVGKVLTVSGDPVSAVRRSRSNEAGLRMGLSKTGELDVSLMPGTSSEFALFLSEWRPDVPAWNGLLIDEQWIPTLGFATVNADAHTDLVFITDADDAAERAADNAADASGNTGGADGAGDGNREQRQLSVLLQNPSRAYAAQPDWQGLVDARSRWQLVDLTGDGLTDLVRSSGEGTESSAYFYRNTGGTFDLQRPDQVLRFSGLGLNLDFSDLNGDGRPELGVSFFSTPVLDAIRNTSIQRSRLIFANIASAATTADQPGAPLFSRRADYRLDESIAADSILGLTSFGNLQVDLDGDGNKDYLQIAGDGTLTARTIGTNLQFAATPFWQYVPNHIVVGFTTESLNADALPDLVLQHSLHFTVLASVE